MVVAPKRWCLVAPLTRGGDGDTQNEWGNTEFWGVTHLSCFRAYSSILMRRTRSVLRFSCPLRSPCRKATCACGDTAGTQ